MATSYRVRADADVVGEMEEMAALGRTPAQIHRALLENFDPSRVPTRRTVERYVRQLVADDDSSPWTLTPARPSPDDGRLLLETLAQVIDETAGSVTTISGDLAAWVIAVRRAVPDLLPWLAYRVARVYQARTTRETDRSDLDAWLAIGPWRGAEETQRYEAAVAQGLPRAPMLLDAVVEGQTARELRGAALRMMIEESDLSGWWRAEGAKIADAFDPHHREFEPDAMEAAKKDTENWLREFVLSRDEAPHGRYESEDETDAETTG